MAIPAQPSCLIVLGHYGNNMIRRVLECFHNNSSKKRVFKSFVIVVPKEGSVAHKEVILVSGSLGSSYYGAIPGDYTILEDDDNVGFGRLSQTSRNNLTFDAAFNSQSQDTQNGMYHCSTFYYYIFHIE